MHSLQEKHTILQEEYLLSVDYQMSMNCEVYKKTSWICCKRTSLNLKCIGQ